MPMSQDKLILENCDFNAIGPAWSRLKPRTTSRGAARDKTTGKGMNEDMEYLGVHTASVLYL